MNTAASSDETSPPPPLYKRQILLVATDLFANVGGGQTAYGALIRLCPDTRYFYFIDKEAFRAPRPSNAIPIPRRNDYYANVGNLPAEMGHFYADYLECWQLARSFVEACPGVDIDVVDTPDYVTLGSFIRPALESHGVRVGTVSLALHGTISSALKDEWGPNASSRSMAELRLRERLQYRAVDSRYALSETYAEDLARVSGGYQANLIDPLLIVGPFNPQMPETPDLDDVSKPDIAFIGRRERRKGPDLFIDALWSLDRDTYGRSMIIGEESKGASGVGSAPVLESMVRLRELDTEFTKHKSRAELDALFETPFIAVLPSRYDQFNLVALEALRLGAPALVSRNAGASRWIRKNIPEIDALTYDLSGARGISHSLRSVVEDYRGFRQRLVDVISKRAFKPDLSTLQGMYAPADKRSVVAHTTVADIRHRFDSFNRPREYVRARSDATSNMEAMPRWKKAILDSPLRPAAEFYHHARIDLNKRLRQPVTADFSDPMRAISDRSPRSLAQLQAAIDFEGIRHRSLTLGERTTDEIASKLRVLSSDAQECLIGRCHTFRDMARLERKRRGNIVAATYGMRLMRWMGHDAFGDLNSTTATLATEGFTREAEATRALFEDVDAADARISTFLDRQFESQRAKSGGAFEVFEDHRGDIRPRVSVIVSLYNAQTKLEAFLRQLGAQSLVQKNQVEIVLVDSGSPTDELVVFRAFVKSQSLPILYVRTKERETIQAAWNRGIQLARGAYLSFLGVDEGVHPDAYRILADALDADPATDWVMADSVVTNVDKNGTFVSDVMTYDRRGYEQGLVYLETCYLSWVGGLYRRSIHERFGYYDETFRGAGDTEFKSRVLPFVRSKHVPKTLGLFLNYPEERTTQHPRAEIEDQRAWYLYRSIAGVSYVWDQKPIADVEHFFRTCLNYRKSYCGHMSTDFDMAHAVARYMIKRAENPDFASAALKSTTQMLDRIRALETIDVRLDPVDRRNLVLSTLIAAKEQEGVDQLALSLDTRPRFEIFNDNRYEQHWYSWSA